VGVQVLEAEHHQLRLYALDFPDSQGCIQEDLLIPLEGSFPGQALQTGQPVVVDRANSTEVSCLSAGEGLQSHCFLPLRSRQGSLGVLWDSSPSPVSSL